MYNPGVFFSVVYPQALPYLKDMRESVLSQTRKDFDVIIVNDGCDKERIIEELQGLDITILEAEGGFSANRMQGINYVRNHKYKYVLFCDADDTFTSDRYERTIAEFEKSQADIVVSNLNIVDEHCKPLIKDYFSKEIPESRWIDAEFLKEKNIFGMSNTAIRLDALMKDLHIPETQIVDWCLFSLLLIKGLKAIYISDSFVNYRQYNANMIGINKYDETSFRRLAKLKNDHYRLLVEKGYDQYQQLYQESERLLNISDIEIKEIVTQGLAKHPQPLWWQIITRNNN